MKDHAVGAFGATALILLLMIKIACFGVLLDDWHVLILAPALARWASVPLCRVLPYARPSGLGKALGDHVGAVEVIGATILTGAGVWWLGGVRGAICAGRGGAGQRAGGAHLRAQDRRNHRRHAGRQHRAVRGAGLCRVARMRMIPPAPRRAGGLRARALLRRAGCEPLARGTGAGRAPGCPPREGGRRVFQPAAPRPRDPARLAAPGMEVRVEPALREIDFGRFEGLTYDEAAAREPELYRVWMERPTEVTFPGGESWPLLRDRVRQFAAGIRQTHAADKVLIVAHGGPLRALHGRGAGPARRPHLPHRSILRRPQHHRLVRRGPPGTDGERMTTIERLAHWAASLRFDEIPHRVVEKARWQQASVVAASLAGLNDSGANKVLAWARAQGGGKTRIIAGGFRAPLAVAAVANAAVSCTFDFDEILLLGHPGHSTVTLPLTLGEELGASWGDSISAQIAGNEIAGRLGLATFLGPQNGQMQPYLHCAGAAIAAGKLLGLDATRMSHALAVALAQPPSALWPSFLGPIEAKVLVAAHATAIGLNAAELAAAGFTGALDLLDHPRGFFHRFSFAPIRRGLGGLGAPGSRTRCRSSCTPAAGITRASSTRWCRWARSIREPSSRSTAGSPSSPTGSTPPSGCARARRSPPMR